MKNENEEAMLSRSRDLSACTAQFLETIGDLRERNLNDVEAIWNASCHVNMVDHDISVFLYFHTTTSDAWAQRSAARSLATIIYEGIEDLSELYGKSFIDACNTAGVYKDVEADHRATKKKLRSFANVHQSFLKGIRVNAGAHKDHDAVQFIEAVISADSGRMIDLACKFSDILVEMGKFSSEVIERVNEAYRQKGIIP